MASFENINLGNISSASFQPLKLNKIALVDADYLKYLFMSRMNYNVQNEGMSGYEEFKEYHKRTVVSELNLLTEDPRILCFSGKSFNTFRHHVALEREYKGSRKSSQVLYEGAYDDLAEFMEQTFDENHCLVFEDLEADDVVSMLQDNDTYILSNDKDLLQVEGLHLDLKTGKVFEITPEEAVKNLGIQILMGDTTDDIVGIPGIGKKKAEVIFKNVQSGDILKTALNCYTNEYGYRIGLEKFIENSSLIMLRAGSGEYFRKKYERAFNLLNTLKTVLKIK